ncbi:Beta-1,3-glucosyltransferase [Zea mays]|uniref:Beta-1,3-glucosyltransferase n=1 Tax=Zea mays TaxID=4577 RepID=A0A3L6FC78_MAIZE|nr:Beta-1,3-glucosyltransferase [Zea mays]
MATPSHGIPLRALLLLALSLLSIPIVFQLLHRPTPSPMPPPLLRITCADAASQSPRANPPPLASDVHVPPPAPKPEEASEPTSLRHVVFGIASSRRTLPLRLPLLRLWLRAPARAFLFLDAPAPDARDLPPGLALRVSADASRFPYTHRRGLPSAVRVARIAGELVSALNQQEEEDVRWLVLADDDTAFVLPNLLHTLRRYDHGEPWYLGARSESAAQNALHGFAMAYGGAGIAVSWPLARRLAPALDSCVLRYPHLYGSDGRIYACLAELGVELTHEPGFHQIDLHGDISGLLRSHPLSPLVSLHHLDHVHPLYPGTDRAGSAQRLFRAADADPARVLQQTVCYDRARSLTASVSWGYAVQVLSGNVPLPDLLAAQRTFAPWRRAGGRGRGRNATDVLYMFDTRRYPGDECRRGALFFLESVAVAPAGEEGGTATVTTYGRLAPRKCPPGLVPLKSLRLVKVTSGRLRLAPGKALRRHCCDIAPSSSDASMDINIRRCKDDELIAMHS